MKKLIRLNELGNLTLAQLIKETLITRKILLNIHHLQILKIFLNKRVKNLLNFINLNLLFRFKNSSIHYMIKQVD